MRKEKEKKKQQSQQCECCGARMEIAEELAPEAKKGNYCANCTPKPTKEPFCEKNEKQR